jgi:hypothetical protein
VKQPGASWFDGLHLHNLDGSIDGRDHNENRSKPAFGMHGIERVWQSCPSLAGRWGLDLYPTKCETLFGSRFGAVLGHNVN